MVHVFVLALLLTALWVAPGHAASDIRGIDFMNFTYQPTLCGAEEGIGKSVQVRKGEWNGKEAYYRVSKVIYGDLTGVGREDAVVAISCVPKAANYSESEIKIYSAQGQQASLIARLDDSDVEREYKRHNKNCVESDQNPTCGLLGIRDIEITAWKLLVKSLAAGSHASPRYVVKFIYKLEDGKLVLAEKPQKRPYKG